jgi:hypothetical protein
MGYNERGGRPDQGESLQRLKDEGFGHGPVINAAQERIFEFFARHSR